MNESYYFFIIYYFNFISRYKPLNDHTAASVRATLARALHHKKTSSTHKIIINNNNRTDKNHS